MIRHEKEGARIAAEVLATVGHDAARTERILEIIDGHDSRRHALSLDDALMKDADKLWRLTPHGVDTVMDWFGLTRQQAAGSQGAVFLQQPFSCRSLPPPP